MTAFFSVRAEIADPADKQEFDRWYQHEHLPLALQTFKPKRAWRAWSEVNPNVHYIFFEFDSVSAPRALAGSDGMKKMAQHFDAAWGDRVSRTREVLDVVQELEATRDYP